MRYQTKAALGVGAVLMGALAFVLLVDRGDEGPVAQASTSEDSVLVRDDSRVLGEQGTSDVTFVEFLDFECESCGAAFPIVEQLREKYAGQVTFVARYFPLDSHFNAERAARAVESAARQGKFEEMYQMMFQTQLEWGEEQEPHDDLFRGYAEELGLDMAEYDTDYASAEVKDRVQRDVDDGLELGVQGTPTFYIDGELVQPESAEDLAVALDAALAE
ncbi:MAG: thioredoxin domain-containing protein [Propionibacteriaceae bacterium]